MLDWIFEGIVTWISSVVTDLMDAVSGLFLDALGTDIPTTYGLRYSVMLTFILCSAVPTVKLQAFIQRVQVI